MLGNYGLRQLYNNKLHLVTSFELVVFPLIRRVAVSTIGADLVAVQPMMPLPTGRVFFDIYDIEYTYNNFRILGIKPMSNHWLVKNNERF